MKKIILSIAVLALAVSCGKVDYKDPTQPIEKRVESLLSQMTLEEKVGQMNQFCGVRHVEQRDKKAQADNQDAQGYYPGINADTLRKWTKEGRIGSYLHVLTPEEANELQELAMQSRLGIPLILGIDAIHGNCLAPNNTSYPTSIGLASSFDTEMAYKIAHKVAASAVLKFRKPT